jgi:hypothetical protein
LYGEFAALHEEHELQDTVDDDTQIVGDGILTSDGCTLTVDGYTLRSTAAP